MAGGTGKYNERLIGALARAAGARPAPGDGVINAADDAEVGRSPAAGSGPGGVAMAASRRHCWALGPPEDLGPHPALLTGGWVRRDAQWWAKVTWYSDAEDAVVQQWLPSTSLRAVR